MWDYTHNQARGYGQILAAALLTADGSLRWKVKFESGQRASSVQQRYLDMSLFQQRLVTALQPSCHHHRQRGSLLQQLAG